MAESYLCLLFPEGFDLLVDGTSEAEQLLPGVNGEEHSYAEMVSSGYLSWWA